MENPFLEPVTKRLDAIEYLLKELNSKTTQDNFQHEPKIVDLNGLLFNPFGIVFRVFFNIPRISFEAIHIQPLRGY